MPREIVVQGFESWRYQELHKIIEWKNGCIYKTKSIGYIRNEDEDRLDKAKYTTSSISTKLSRLPQFVIEVLTSEEVDKLETK